MEPQRLRFLSFARVDRTRVTLISAPLSPTKECETKMLLRGEQFVLKAAYYGVISALLISTSTFVASAEDQPTAAVPATVEGSAISSGIVILGNDTVAAAPAPDTRPAVAGSGQTAAPDARPTIIIKDGVVTMMPVGDSVPAAVTSDAVRPDSETECLANAVYFEARGESTRGQEAVAQVVLARVKTPGRPKSICGVVYEGSKLRSGCQFSFTCDGVPDIARDRAAFERAERIATSAMRGDLQSVAGGATFYHASYVRPHWASHMVKVATIGTHIFYRP
jgi:spore germination cell wall hydrolase CwlJ-like protein